MDAYQQEKKLMYTTHIEENLRLLSTSMTQVTKNSPTQKSAQLKAAQSMAPLMPFTMRSKSSKHLFSSSRTERDMWKGNSDFEEEHIKSQIQGKW